MELTPEDRREQNLIRSYGDAEVRVGEQLLRRSCVVMPGALIADWGPAVPRSVSVADLQAVVATRPEVIVAGWYAGHALLPAEVRGWLLQQRIGIEGMNLGAACRTYNVLAQERRAVAALLFLQADQPARESAPAKVT